MTKTAEQQVRDYEIQKRMAAKEKRIARKKSQKGQTKARTSQQKRRAETLKWRAKRKRELWEGDEQYKSLVIEKMASGSTRYSWGVFCGLCGGWIAEFEDAELDHKIPVRRGGDTDENTHLVHALGNRAKGSVSLEAYLLKPLSERRRACGVRG